MTALARREAKTRVFIVDDHPIIRRSLAALIRATPGLDVCGEAEDVQGALADIPQAAPDLVLVDISLKGPSGLELLKDLKLRHPRLPALVLSMHDERLFAERCLRAGARGYVMKNEALDELVHAIRRVLTGEIYTSPTLFDRPPRDGSSVERLSDRELEVFEKIGLGVSSREIASRLHVSVKTIETHRERIKDKLGCASGADLLRQATHWVLNRRGL
jgi:DNA-binding NarL/FixJ family response regulator